MRGVTFSNCCVQADLHVHIEGTFEPQLMLEIAERNGKMGLLPFKDLQAAKEAYNFQNLQSFLDIYYAGCAVLLHEKASRHYPRPTSGPHGLNEKHYLPLQAAMTVFHK